MKKTQTDEKTVKTWDEVHEVLATEVIGQARKQAKRWMMAFLVALALLVGSNVAWVYAYTTAVEQEAE
nr:MAG TPA: immunity protein [Caudoviricetes sp.]